MITNKDITLSVFFPAYYDEKNIDKVVIKAVEVLDSLELKDYEVTIIEDGSPDKTDEVADALAARFPKVKVVHHEKNMGYGATLWEGFTTARMDYVFYTDGDNQFDLDELRKFVAVVPYSDMVVGFRKKKQYSTYRKITSFVYNLILKWAFDIDYLDIDCAFKIIKTDLFRNITVSTKDAFIDAEIMIKAELMGYSSVEIGVTHLPRVDGVSTAARPSIILKTMLEIYEYRKEYKRIKASQQKNN